MARHKLSRPIKVSLAVAAWGTLSLILCSAIYSLHDEVVVAAHQGNVAKVRVLSCFDFKLSRVGYEEHFTPLGAAAASKNVELVRLLINKGVDVNTRDDSKRTALYYAQTGSDDEIVGLLKTHGAR